MTNLFKVLVALLKDIATQNFKPLKKLQFRF